MNTIMKQIFEENQYTREDRQALETALGNHRIYLLQKMEEYEKLLMRQEKQEYEPSPMPLEFMFDEEDRSTDPAKDFEEGKAENIAWLKGIIESLKKELEANNKVHGKLLIHRLEPEMFGELK